MSVCFIIIICSPYLTAMRYTNIKLFSFFFSIICHDIKYLNNNITNFVLNIEIPSPIPKEVKNRRRGIYSDNTKICGVVISFIVV